MPLSRIWIMGPSCAWPVLARLRVSDGSNMGESTTCAIHQRVRPERSASSSSQSMTRISSFR